MYNARTVQAGEPMTVKENGAGARNLTGFCFLSRNRDFTI